MKTHYFVIGACIVIVFALAFFLLQRKQAPSGTGFLNMKNSASARLAYEIGKKSMDSLHKDAYLVDLFTNATKTGENETWQVQFYSPSSNVQIKFLIKNGAVVETINEKPSKKKPVGENWVDSVRAAKIAEQYCAESEDNKYLFSLDAISGKPQWSVSCLVGENKTLRVKIDAVTGVFIKTSRAGIGW